MQTDKTWERYQRQILLPGFGKETQELLFAAKVLVVGAGGLGCPVLLYLAAAGIGRLGIVDFDRVALSNLHRQILYGPQDIGQTKSLLAAQKIGSAYPDTEVKAYNTRLDTTNALEIFRDYDLVVDGSDNFPTRYLVNDACVLLRKPLVYGSVFRSEGQVAVFNLSREGETSTSYRDLFPTPPTPEEAPNCAEAGVLGVLPGIIGSLQANEAIKIITGIGDPLANRLLTFNALSNTFYTVSLSPQSEAQPPAPAHAQAFKSMRYEQFCGLAAPGVEEVEPAVFEQLSLEPDTLVIDVRNPWEQPKMEGSPVHSLPLGQLENRLQELEAGKQLLLFCQAGSRSLQAAQQIREYYPEKNIYCLKGGISAWSSYQYNKPSA